jgi:hypothetical protein
MPSSPSWNLTRSKIDRYFSSGIVFYVYDRWVQLSVSTIGYIFLGERNTHSLSNNFIKFGKQNLLVSLFLLRV